MKQMHMTSLIAVIAAALASLTVPRSAAQCPPQQRAGLEADFNERLKPYLKLRGQAESKVPPLEGTKDPAKLTSRRDALANRIRATRASARQGDILGGAVADCLVATTRRHLKADTAKRTAKEGNPVEEGQGIKLAVNAPYRSDAPLSTMPPDLLADLPKLPKGLEYRFVGKALILYDSEARLIIDYVPNAGV